MTFRGIQESFARRSYRDRMVGVAAAVFAAVAVVARITAAFGPLLSRSSLTVVVVVAACVVVGAVIVSPWLSIRRFHAALAALAGVGFAAVGVMVMAMGTLWVVYMLFKAAGWMVDIIAPA